MPKPKLQMQPPPFCIQVELVEGCNLRCSFCGLNGIRAKDNNFKFMSKSTLARLCHQLNGICWNSRLEFAMHGEPSVHPELASMLSMVRKRCPKKHMMMTSNGAGFFKDPSLIDQCLESLNVLALDWYENIVIVPKLLEKYDGKHTPVRYPENQHGNPHRRRKLDEHHFVVVQDIQEATAGTHATLNNHAGAGAPKNSKAQGKRCAKPFRELSIRWDGSVALCCNDWRGEYSCGSINDTEIHEIWNNKEFRAARKKLYHGMRDFGPCDGCDALSYRPGLLPDQKGQEDLPEPSPRDLAIIDQVLAAPPLTTPVLREWEE